MEKATSRELQQEDIINSLEEQVKNLKIVITLMKMMLEKTDIRFKNIKID